MAFLGSRSRSRSPRRRSSPDKFSPIFFCLSIGRSSIKLATRIPYGQSIMTFVFLSPFFEKKFPPPLGL